MKKHVPQSAPGFCGNDVNMLTLDSFVFKDLVICAFWPIHGVTAPCRAGDTQRGFVVTLTVHDAEAELAAGS